jgi:hypothetical protein
MKYRTRTYYTDGQKALMWERWREGWTLHQICSSVQSRAYLGSRCSGADRRHSTTATEPLRDRVDAD